MVPAGNKAKSLSPVNHTTKTIHLHHHHLVQNLIRTAYKNNIIQIKILSGVLSNTSQQGGGTLKLPVISNFRQFQISIRKNNCMWQ